MKKTFVKIHFQFAVNFHDAITLKFASLFAFPKD